MDLVGLAPAGAVYPGETTAPGLALPTGPAAEGGLPPERVRLLRSAIDEHLRSSNIYEDVRRIINSHAADQIDDPLLAGLGLAGSESALLGALRERGVIGQVLGAVPGAGGPGASFGGLGSGPVQATRHASVPLRGSAAAAVQAQGLLSSTRPLLHMRLLGGRAFLDLMDEASRAAVANPQSVMVAHVHFGSQRFRSAAVPAAVDPAFDDDFVAAFEPSVRDLVEYGAPLHVVVTLEDPHGVRSRVVGENVVDWRRALTAAQVNLSVELAGATPGVPAGILELHLEVAPSSVARRWTQTEVQARVDADQQAATAADREFLLYARRWWAEYHALAPAHASRKVKVFAQAPSGRMLPVTHFVSVVQPDRVLDSPEDAARFVALLAVEDASADPTREVLTGSAAATAGGARGERWQSTMHFLSQRRGDAPNHAALLCSMLLGFGLDAYCIVCGTAGGNGEAGATSAGSGATIMVATRRRVASVAEALSQPGGGGCFEVTLWEPTTGRRFAVDGSHRLLTVGCAFNDSMLYGCIAPDDRVPSVSFDFDDHGAWKPMNPIKLRLVPAPPPPPLLWIPRSERDVELRAEAALRGAIVDHRERQAVQTFWDEDLAFVFSQALVRYEAHRRGTTAAVDLSHFHAGVKGKLGPGRTFKGAPVNVAHTDARRVLAALLATEAGRAVLETDAEEATHAVRARAFLFPEGVVSLWMMVGVRHRTIPQHPQ